MLNFLTHFPETKLSLLSKKDTHPIFTNIQGRGLETKHRKNHITKNWT